jgi:hypothetical protein
MSYRELWVLITRLPQESWTQTALRDSPEHAAMRSKRQNEPVRFGPWALENYQLAELIDAIRQNTWMTQVMVPGRQGPPPPAPPRTPRPGAEPAAVRSLTPEGLSYLQRIHSRREET